MKNKILALVMITSLVLIMSSVGCDRDDKTTSPTLTTPRTTTSTTTRPTTTTVPTTPTTSTTTTFPTTPTTTATIPPITTTTFATTTPVTTPTTATTTPTTAATTTAPTTTTVPTTAPTTTVPTTTPPVTTPITAPPTEGKVKITLAGGAFTPATVTVKNGGIVEFDNADHVDYLLISDYPFSQLVPSETSFEMTLSKVGTFKYWNESSPNNKGTIIVVA